MNIFNLSNNNNGDEAAGDIANVLSHNVKLQILNINKTDADNYAIFTRYF